MTESEAVPSKYIPRVLNCNKQMHNRIVHFGVGNFHRAHQAWYTSKLEDWFITGVVMSNEKLYSELLESKYRYTLGIWDADGLSTEEICVFDNVILASKNSNDVIEVIADPKTQIVTLTITEKGYHLDANGKCLDWDSTPIKRDLHSDQPITAIGILVAGIVKRHNMQGTPLTVISCDNLSNNGKKLGKLIFEFISKKEPRSVQWMLENVVFPCTMVDRITPHLSESAIREIQSVSVKSKLPVVGTEAFSEWIIEDRFNVSKPDWEKQGAKIVVDVASFEERKLRLLNAGHSFLAYSGLKKGYEFVHEAIADKTLKSDVKLLWDETGMTVSVPASNSLDEYRKAILNRFSVRSMRHSLNQIAMDGSIKLKERLRPVWEVRCKLGLSSPMILKAVSVWAEFVIDTIHRGKSLQDPMADKFKQIINSNPSNPGQSLVELILDSDTK